MNKKINAKKIKITQKSVEPNFMVKEKSKIVHLTKWSNEKILEYCNGNDELNGTPTKHSKTVCVENLITFYERNKKMGNK